MKDLTRRQFLTLSAAGAGVMALSKSASAGERPWNSRVTRSVRKFDESMETACGSCDSHCSLTAYRQQGRIACLLPTEGGCPRGIESLEALYDGERVLYPLKRSGERGSGNWERISWEEAVSIVTAGLKAANGENVADIGRPDPMAATLLPELGFNKIVTERYTRSWGSFQAKKALFGDESAQADIGKAATILLWGANSLDDGDDFARSVSELVEAKARGAKIVTVSSRAGATGSFSDHWIPIRPGAEVDGAMALLKTLLANDIGNVELLKSLGGLEKAEIEGALSAVSDRNSGLSGSDISFLSNIFNDSTVAVWADGSGLTDAKSLESAVALLNLLGSNRHLRPSPMSGYEIRGTVPREAVTKDLLKSSKKIGVYLAYRANPVYSSPESRKFEKALKDESKVGLVISFDTNLTETGLVADLVLPATADLESWNLLTGICPDGGAGYLLQRPVQVWDTEPKLLRAKETELNNLFDGPQPGAAGEAMQLGDMLTLAAFKMGAAAPYGSCAAAALSGAARVGMRGRETWVPANRELVEVKAYGDILLDFLGAYRPAPPATGLLLTPFNWVELDTSYPNSVFGREIRFEQPVYLNAATAKKLGLKKGDRAKLRFAEGEITARVFPLQTLHPEAVAIARDFGHWASGSAASLIPASEGAPKLHGDRKEFLKDSVKVAKSLLHQEKDYWWQEHGPGASVNAATPLRTDGDGAQLWREIAVAVGRG